MRFVTSPSAKGPNSFTTLPSASSMRKWLSEASLFVFSVSLICGVAAMGAEKSPCKGSQLAAWPLSDCKLMRQELRAFSTTS